MLWSLFFFVFVSFLFTCVFIYMVLSFCNIGDWRKQADKWQHLLVIIAHPDDECMFFSPSIMDFIGKQKHVSLLCLSGGTYMQLASTRQKELFDSCKILGINNDNIKIIGDSYFPDDPSRIWNEELVARAVLKHLEIIKPDVVLTFDQYGVSGHNNHCSIYYGCKKLLQDGRAPAGISFYSLESTNILRKYMSLLDIPFSVMFTSKFYVSTISAVITSVRAMCSYSTQLNWYRVLYLLFSRYMIINTLVDMVPDINVPPDG